MGEREPISGLLDEDFISIYPSLAVRAGINKAAILQKLHYLVQITRNSNNQANHIEGRWWVYNTYAEWQKQYFPWLSVSTLKRLFLELEQDGIVLSWAPADNSRKKYYTINYDYWPTWFEQTPAPDETPQDRSEERRPSSQNETVEARIKMIRPSSQNDTMVVSKRDDPPSQNDTTVEARIKMRRSSSQNDTMVVSKRDDPIYKESETTQRLPESISASPENGDRTEVIARAPDGAARSEPRPHAAAAKHKPRPRNPFYDMLAEVWFEIKPDTPEFAALGGRIAQHAAWLSGKAITVKRRNGGTTESVEIPGCRYDVTRELLLAAKRAWGREYPGTTPPYDILKFVTWVGAWLTRNVKPTGGVEHRRDPNCDYCGGTGLILPDVPPEHPLYNEVFPCPKCGTVPETSENKEVKKEVTAA